MESRYEIYMERYIKDVTVEARLTLEIARTTIFPATVKYQHQLASAALALKQLGKDPCLTVLDEVTGLARNLQDAIVVLEKTLETRSDGSTLDHATHVRDHLIPAMGRVREVADRLECVVSDEFWPLPTYQEMLFIK